jgi:Protein of unknown function (DUF3179)
MRDEETGSYWQQITGSAIAGPLKGSKLTLLPQDELSFALWRKEQPSGTVLAPLPRYAAKYEKATWENEVAKLPTVIHGTKGSLADRDTIIGVVSGGAAKAYPLAGLTAQSPVVLDTLDDEPLMLVLGPDGKSVRVFSRRIGGKTLEFYGHSAASPSDSWTLVDDATLSGWGFNGCSVSGEMMGQCLKRIEALKDYWFDWQHYHPHSSIFRH